MSTEAISPVLRDLVGFAKSKLCEKRVGSNTSHYNFSLSYEQILLKYLFQSFSEYKVSWTVRSSLTSLLLLVVPKENKTKQKQAAMLSIYGTWSISLRIPRGDCYWLWDLFSHFFFSVVKWSSSRRAKIFYLFKSIINSNWGRGFVAGINCVYFCF